jgi:site-specific DNA-methyltransferase (adenine-specific)
MTHPFQKMPTAETLADQLRRKWQTACGQIWEVESLSAPGSRHRVMCGDANNARHRHLLTFGQTCDVLHGDPPYGINLMGRKSRRFGKSKTLYKPVIGDDRPFNPAPFLGLSETVMLWGANHYANALPNSPFWIVWDKLGGAKHLSFADCELAWSNHRQQARLLTHVWSGFRRDSERGMQRYHPTQKPVAVIEWALRWLPGTTVLELWLGSGSTLLASERLGRCCFGMEIDPAYVAVTLERAAQAGMRAHLVDQVHVR